MGPLHIAVEKENLEIVQLLLKDPKLNVNLLCNSSQNIKKTTEAALHIAAEKENIEIIKLLLTNDKIDINLACLIEAGCTLGNYKRDEKTALHIGIEKRNIDIIKLLLQNKQIKINSPFISYYSFKDVDFEFDNKHKSKREKTVLHLAVEKNEFEIVQLLLSCENLDINYPVKFTSSGESTTFKMKYKSKIEEENNALFIAVDEGNVDIVRILLQNDKIDVNLPFKHKLIATDVKNAKYHELTPLHTAVKYKKVEIVRLLLENDNIDVNIPIKSSDESESNKTALHLAVKEGEIEIVKMLMANKNININVFDAYSKTPINYTDSDDIKSMFNIK